MTGKLNRRVTISEYSTTQDEAGGLEPVLVSTYTLWAQVEDRIGSQVASHAQTLWNYDYKVTVRYEENRVIKSNMVIEYDGKKLTIRSVAFENEGRRKYAVCRCSAIDNDV